jgi:hypothetical protein
MTIASALDASSSGEIAAAPFVRGPEAEKEIGMVLQSKSIGPLVLRLLAVVLLLGCPRIGIAAGTWSVISLPQKPGEVLFNNALSLVQGPTGALAADAAGSLYVADQSNGARIQKRDAQGNWSVLATAGSASGQVDDSTALAVDAAGNLYVAEVRHCAIFGPCGRIDRIQKRDA